MAAAGATTLRGWLHRYLGAAVSRRQFMAGLAQLGIGAAAAESVAQELSPFVVRRDEPAGSPLPPGAEVVRGAGGHLLVAQLKASGQEFLFANPSSGATPVYDALVDEPTLPIIHALHEGALAAMADGYARASGKTPFVLIARPGLPNAMTQMYNAWKDGIPMVVAIELPGTQVAGRDYFEEVEHADEMTAPITKWRWNVETARKIPEVVRRAIKFASTRPSGPVFLGFPDDLLAAQERAVTLPQSAFHVPTRIRPDSSQIGQAARLLARASNPLLYVGDEVTLADAADEVLQLAELLALPVATSMLASWSRPFPTHHPLYIGEYVPASRFPGKVDVLLNLGGRMPNIGPSLQMEPDTQLVEVRTDTANLARSYPTALPIVADVRSAAAELLEAVKGSLTARELARVRTERHSRVRQYTERMRSFYRDLAKERWDSHPISLERLISELESALDPQTCVVAECDSARSVIGRLMSFDGAGKRHFANTGVALGWGVPAAFGVKLAMPDRPVVAIVGDGAFLFSGPQPLWTYVRHRAPITVVVVDNRSYNGERNRIWQRRGRQYQTGRDMVCYLGSPDIDFVKLAGAFDVEGEKVEQPSELPHALKRAMRANAEGRPYLLDVLVARTGPGADSTWFPQYHVGGAREVS